ncbi:MAG: hypothetical protein RJA90_447 [Bacteroidota bacterium]
MTDQIRFEGNKTFALEMDSKDELRSLEILEINIIFPKKKGRMPFTFVVIL